VPLHLYAVVRGTHPLPGDLTGVRDGKVRLVGSESTGLAVAVTDVPDGAEVTEDDAVRHLDTLTALLPGGPVVPLRLGTVAPDEDSVRAELLDDVDHDLGARLDGLEGLVEVHVDAADDEDARLRAILADDPGLRAGRDAAGSAQGTLDQQVRLGEMVAARLAEHRAADADRVLAHLAPLTLQDSPRGSDDGWVLRHAFLLRADDMPAFDVALDDLQHDYGDAVAFSRAGPLPVFSFTVLSGSGRSRWGW